MKPTALQRFMAKVEIAEDGCWVWQAYISPGGYGQFAPNRNKTAAHRVSYRWFVGEIPEGLELDHLCRNRACVNPAHLEAVTRRENALRGIGWAGLNARKTHCKHGHPFDEENTYIKQGARTCRTCQREADRAKGRRRRREATATRRVLRGLERHLKETGFEWREFA